MVEVVQILAVWDKLEINWPGWTSSTEMSTECSLIEIWFGSVTYLLRYLRYFLGGDVPSSLSVIGPSKVFSKSHWSSLYRYLDRNSCSSVAVGQIHSTRFEPVAAQQPPHPNRKRRICPRWRNSHCRVSFRSGRGRPWFGPSVSAPIIPSSSPRQLLIMTSIMNTRDFSTKGLPHVAKVTFKAPNWMKSLWYDGRGRYCDDNNDVQASSLRTFHFSSYVDEWRDWRGLCGQSWRDYMSLWFDHDGVRSLKEEYTFHPKPSSFSRLSRTTTPSATEKDFNQFYSSPVLMLRCPPPQ